MGAVVSRWRAKPTTVEVLEGIDKDIQALEEYKEKNQRQLKLWVWRLLLYSTILYLISSVVVYTCYLPEQTIGRLIIALPFLVFPILIWFLRKLMIALFSKSTERNNDKLEDLKSQKRKILEQVMETETYKNAKLILERFDPDSKRKIELEATPIGPAMTPRPGQELRQRNVTPRPAPMLAPSPAAARPPLAPGSGKPSSDPALSHAAPGGPPERNLAAATAAAAAHQNFLRRSMAPGTPVPGMGMHPPGPPLARPVLPRDRGALDRVIEYFVGDGPQNRYALICQQCLSHNGMALKEEFEYIAFRCAYCYFLNPARKTRPQAPRLPEPRLSSPDLTAMHTPAATAGADLTPTTTNECELEAAAAPEKEAPESEVGLVQAEEVERLEEEHEKASPEKTTEEEAPATPKDPEPTHTPASQTQEGEDHNTSAMEVD